MLYIYPSYHNIQNRCSRFAVDNIILFFRGYRLKQLTKNITSRRSA